MTGPERSVGIERLVLRGLLAGPAEAERIRAQVESELARLVNAPGALDAMASADRSRITGPPVSSRRSNLAAGVARSVLRALGGTEGGR